MSPTRAHIFIQISLTHYAAITISMTLQKKPLCLYSVSQKKKKEEK